jgi:hypothetical protein
MKNSSRFLSLTVLFALASLAASTCAAQSSFTELQKALTDKAAFTQTDFLALGQNQPVVKLLPARDKREVVVAGLVPLQATAEIFLQSFRENMIRKNNPAILEIGAFGQTPTIEDLQQLTFEDADIEDLKDCVVGDCQLKLSEEMIERLHKEVDWDAPDFRPRAIQVLKLMLLDYVREYLSRGDQALIEYHDKESEVRLADEQRDLMAVLGHAVLADVPQFLKSRDPDLRPVEEALVWPKIKFGLKPVIAINHISIYTREAQSGPQILIATKQIYANHYFDSSLALTAFLNVPGANPGTFLFYENRSRADGLGGVFSKLKRRVVENRALESVKAILQQSQLSLQARALNPDEPLPKTTDVSIWRRWKTSRLVACLLVLCIGAVILFVALRSKNWRIGVSRAAN